MDLQEGEKLFVFSLEMRLKILRWKLKTRREVVKTLLWDNYESFYSIIGCGTNLWNYDGSFERCWVWVRLIMMSVNIYMEGIWVEWWWDFFIFVFWSWIWTIDIFKIQTMCNTIALKLHSYHKLSTFNASHLYLLTTHKTSLKTYSFLSHREFLFRSQLSPP